METVVAILLIVGLVVLADRLFRHRFRQEGEDTVGNAQRIGRGGPRRPMGEVIDEVQGRGSDNGERRSSP